MQTFDLVQAVGKARGHFKTKENRVAKLISMWPELKRKMEAMVERGRGKTEQARLAYGVLLMMQTGIRVGNEDSAEGFVCENKLHKDFGKTVQTFGLTTLLNKHVDLHSMRLTLSFTGKKLVDQTLMTGNYTLVHYCPKGKPDDLWLGITDAAIRKFVKRYVGSGFTPKDLRAAKVNIMFVDKFANHGFAKAYAASKKKSERKKILGECIAEVAETIGHTKAVCRSSYLSKPLLANLMLTDQGYVYVSSLKWQEDL